MGGEREAPEGRTREKGRWLMRRGEGIEGEEFYRHLYGWGGANRGGIEAGVCAWVGGRGTPKRDTPMRDTPMFSLSMPLPNVLI